MRRHLLILWMGFCILLSGFFVSFAEEQKDSSNSIEVIIQNKQYESVHAYKREQIKKTLKRALSSYNLREFSEDELYGIMKEVRKQQTANRSSKRNSEDTDQLDKGLPEDPQEVEEMEENARGLSASQMEQMLREYHREHKGAKDILIDPDKVKSIIIEPQAR